jgi:tetratricopeptide (TPR) repeat protein
MADVAFTLIDIGDLKLAEGDNTAALPVLEEAAAIRRRLVEAEPGNKKRQWDLSVVLGKVGDINVALGSNTPALAAYEEALRIDRELSQADPNNIDWQTAPAWDLYGIAQVSSDDGRSAALDEALKIVEGLGVKGLTPSQEELKEKLRALRDSSIAKDGN